MRATSIIRKVITKVITIDLGYSDDERNAIINFCQEVVHACDDRDIAGQVITNIALGHPHFVSKEEGNNYEIFIK